MQQDYQAKQDLKSLIDGAGLTGAGELTVQTHVQPAVTPFTFQNLQVRVLERDGEPWFVAADVCQALDIVNVSDAVNRLDSDEKDGIVTADTVGRKNNLLAVNESGLYNLIFSSRKAEANVFRKWVTSEVLPTIRKTGGYKMPRPALDKKQLKESRDDFFELYRNLSKDGHEHLAALSMADDVVRTTTGYSFLEAGHNPHLTRQLASELRENPDKPERLLTRSQQVTLDIAVGNCARAMNGLSFQIYDWLCEVMDVVAQERIPRHRLVEALNLLKVKKAHELELTENRLRSCPVCGGLAGVAQ